MADKIYEAGTPIASGVYPKGDFFLVNAEDVQVGEKKSLAEYIAEGGGSGGGDVVVDGNCAYRYIETDLGRENTIVSLRAQLRDAGVSPNDRCLVHCVSYSFPDIVIKVSDTFANHLITVSEFYEPSNPINYAGTISAVTLIGTLIDTMQSRLATTAQTIEGAINEVNSRARSALTAIQELENKPVGGGGEIVTTTGTSMYYEATVASITELKAGVSFTMIAHLSNSPYPNLNVNGWGSVSLARRQNSADYSTRTLLAGELKKDYPYKVMYTGSVWVIDATEGLPYYSHSDDGKFLRIVNGQPAWVLITNAEEASF